MLTVLKLLVSWKSHNLDTLIKSGYTVNNLTKMFTWCTSKFSSLNKFVPSDLKNVNGVKTAPVLQESLDNLHDFMKTQYQQ